MMHARKVEQVVLGCVELAGSLPREPSWGSPPPSLISSVLLLPEDLKSPQPPELTHSSQLNEGWGRVRGQGLGWSVLSRVGGPIPLPLGELSAFDLQPLLAPFLCRKEVKKGHGVSG